MIDAVCNVFWVYYTSYLRILVHRSVLCMIYFLFFVIFCKLCSKFFLKSWICLISIWFLISCWVSKNYLFYTFRFLYSLFSTYKNSWIGVFMLFVQMSFLVILKEEYHLNLEDLHFFFHSLPLQQVLELFVAFLLFVFWELL